MNRKLLIFLVSLLLFVFFAGATLAQDTTSPSPFRVRKENVKERVEEKREAVKERVSARKEDLATRRQDNLRKYLQNMVARLKATVIRLETLIARIESRLERIATENPDTDLSAIKADVEEAKSLLNGVKDKITDLAGTEDLLVTSDTPKTAFQSIRSKLESIKKDLKEVHRLLVHVIGGIKGLRVGEDKK